jgi:6-phosphogluconolactonase
MASQMPRRHRRCRGPVLWRYPRHLTRWARRVGATPSGVTRRAGLVAALVVLVCLGFASSAVALTPAPGSPFEAGTYPLSVAFSPSGGLLANANAGDGTVSLFSVNQTTGAVTPVSGSPFAAGSYQDQVYSVAFSPGGRLLATVNQPEFGGGTVSVFSVSQTSGALSPVAGSPFTTGSAPTSVAFSPSGGLLATANLDGDSVSLFSVNETSGAVTPVAGSPVPAGYAPSTVAFSPSGGLLGTVNAGDSTVSVFSVNQTSGALSPVAGSPFATGSGPATNPYAVAFSPSGGLLATANRNGDSVSLFSVNQTSGALTPLAGSPFATGTNPISVAFSPSGALLATSNYDQATVSVFFVSGLAPVSKAPPRVTGPARSGRTLSCSRGSWTNNPTTYAFQWYRNSAPLAGFNSSTYKLGTLDEGTTLTCVVTASNSAGHASARSNAVKIPIPKVARCPGATGSMTGTTIGQIKLGMTRTRARYLYRRHSNHGKQYEDFFCLTPIGVRVGYASAVLLETLPKHARAPLRGRVVWASTSNPYYALDGVHAGESITTASQTLKTEAPIHIGLNYWYLARKPRYTAVLKVRGDVVQELGIATNALTKTRKTQVVLMHSFY